MLIRNWTTPREPTSSLVCSAENDGGDGGGGGGGDGGGTVDQAQRDLIMRTVNAAVTSQLGRKLPEAIKEGMDIALAPLQEQLAKMAGGGGGGKGKGKGAGEGSEDGEVGELRNQVKALTAQINNEKEARKVEADKHAQAQLEASLRGELSKAGVRAELLDGAVATIRSNVSVTESGPTWRMQRQGYHEDLPLGDAIKEWIQTDTGKAHLAPANVSGSGNLPGKKGGPRPGPTPPDAASAKREEKTKALEKLAEQTKDLLNSGTVEL